MIAIEPRHPIVDPGGPVVCGAVSRAHAAAYGFKDKDYFSFINGSGEAPVAIIGTDKDAKFFLEELRKRRTYIARLAAQAFTEGLFQKEPKNGELPVEWYSRNDVAILQIDAVPNDEVVRMGVQLFVVNQEVFNESEKMEALFEKLHVCRENKGLWINLLPEYDNPSPWLINHVGSASLWQKHLKPSRSTGNRSDITAHHL